MKKVFNRRTCHQSTARFKQACENLKAAVHEAKNKWIKSQCASLNTNIGKKSAWDAINTFKGGLSKPRPSSSNQMKCPDGSLCQTPKENSEVFCDYFQTLTTTFMVDNHILKKVFFMTYCNTQYLKEETI